MTKVTMVQYSDLPKAGAVFMSSKEVNPAIQQALYARGIDSPEVKSLLTGTGAVVEIQRESICDGPTFTQTDKVISISIDQAGKITLCNNTEKTQVPLSSLRDLLGGIPAINGSRLSTRSVNDGETKQVGSSGYRSNVTGNSLTRAYALSRGHHLHTNVQSRSAIAKDVIAREPASMIIDDPTLQSVIKSSVKSDRTFSSKIGTRVVRSEDTIELEKSPIDLLDSPTRIIYKSLISPQLKSDSIDPSDEARLIVKLTRVSSNDNIRVGLGSPTLDNHGVWVESYDGWWFTKPMKDNIGPVKNQHTIIFQLTGAVIKITIDDRHYQVKRDRVSYIPVIDADSSSKVVAKYTLINR